MADLPRRCLAVGEIYGPSQDINNSGASGVALAEISALPFKEPETGIHDRAAHVSLLVGVSLAAATTAAAAAAAAVCFGC